MPGFEAISATTYDAAQTGTVIPAPSGIQAGDLLLLFQITGQDTEAMDPTPADGAFTLLPNVAWPVEGTAFGFNIELRVYSKVADETDEEATTYVVSHATGSRQGAVARISGPFAEDPFTPDPVGNSGSGATTTLLGVTTTVANTLLIGAGFDFAGGSNTLTPPTGSTPTFTEQLDSGVLYVASGVLAAPGATGDKTFTNNNAGSNPWGSVMIAIAPPSGSDTAPEFTDDPEITGTPTVGETLTCSDGTVTGTPTPTVAKQWQRDDQGGGSWSNISSETGDTYELAETDLDCMIRCVVTATNTEGEDEATSNEVGPVTAAPPVTVTVRYTGDGTAAGSTGGAPHANEVASAILPATPALNGLMDNVTVDEAANGEDEYRAIALVNEDLERAAALTISVSEAPDPGTGVSVEIGLAPEGVGEDAEEIADDKTAPTSVDWQTAATPETGLTVEVPADSFIVVWIHRETAAEAAGTGLAVELQVDVAPPEEA